MNVPDLLGPEAELLLEHKCTAIPQDMLILPGPDFIDRAMTASDRPPGVLRSFGHLFGAGRLGGTGYLSILPVGLINSGGASSGPGDIREAVRTAVINKRAGGTGLIVDRKAFRRPLADGVELLHAVQDVYLDATITVA